jgi:hypothetical protein
MAEHPTSSYSVRNLRAKASIEFRKFLIIFVYLWIVFAALAIHESIIRAQHGLDYQAHGFAFINAFVLAKVLLVGDHFRLGTRYMHKPLVYPVVHQCLAFSILLIGFHVAEKMLVGMVGGKTAEESIREIGGGTWIGIFALSALAFVMLIPFFAFRQLSRRIGEQEMWSYFFGHRANPGGGKRQAEVESSEKER